MVTVREVPRAWQRPHPGRTDPDGPDDPDDRPLSAALCLFRHRHAAPAPVSMQGMDLAAVTRSVVFAVSLLALLVAHQVGDHVVQTDRQATGKTSGGNGAARAMLGHLCAYHATALVVLVATAAVLGLPLSVVGVAAGLAFSALTHGLLDLRWPVRAVLRAAGAARFADATTPVCGMYAADQALHTLCLLASALLIAAL